MINDLGRVDTASELAQKVAEAKERTIIQQLNNLITEGIIVIESTKPTLIQQQTKEGVVVSLEQLVILKSKHDEVISNLRKENTVMKEQLYRIKDRLGRCLEEYAHERY